MLGILRLLDFPSRSFILKKSKAVLPVIAVSLIVFSPLLLLACHFEKPCQIPDLYHFQMPHRVHDQPPRILIGARRREALELLLSPLPGDRPGGADLVVALLHLELSAFAEPSPCIKAIRRTSHLTKPSG
jgi:hypothetical protein